MGWDSIKDIYYKKLIKQISGEIDEKDGELLPEYIIKGKGHIWCYQPTVRKMLRISRNIKVYILSEEEDASGRVLVYTSIGDVIAIEKDELFETGYN